MSKNKPYLSIAGNRSAHSSLKTFVLELFLEINSEPDLVDTSITLFSGVSGDLKLTIKTDRDVCFYNIRDREKIVFQKKIANYGFCNEINGSIQKNYNDWIDQCNTRRTCEQNKSQSSKHIT